MMMNVSALSKAQQLESVWGPVDDCGNQSGARIGYQNVQCILVTHLAGPMGFYDVARVIHDDDSGKADIYLPLHMMEYIETLPEAPE
jgi:hypothetical protein